MSQPETETNTDAEFLDSLYGDEPMEEVNDSTQETNQVDETQATTEQVASKEELPAKEETPSPVASNTEDITKALKEGFEEIKKTSTPAPVEEKPKLSQEELEKYLRKAKFTEEDLKEIGLVNDDTEAELATKRLQALSKINSRVVEEAKAYTELMVQAAQQKLVKQFEPLVEAHRAQQEKQTETEFYQAYPKFEQHKNIVNLVAQVLESNQTFQGKTKEEAFELVSKETEKYLQELGNNTPAASHKSEEVQSQVPTPASSTTSSRRSQESTTPSAGTSVKENPMSIFEDY